LLHLIAILFVGRGQPDGQQIPQGIHRDMGFGPFFSFGSILPGPHITSADVVGSYNLYWATNQAIWQFLEETHWSRAFGHTKALLALNYLRQLSCLSLSQRKLIPSSLKF
jgi:hypothetical protein